MHKVLIGFLGTTLDRGDGLGRWQQWRPTVALLQHENLLIDRFELLTVGKSTEVRDRVIADIATVSPETEVRVHELPIKDPWDFEVVFGVLHDFARRYAFDTEREDYLIHITTGTHVAQICLFLLTESRHLPCRLVQTSPPREPHTNEPGRYNIIDLDLSRYDKIAQRFASEKREGAEFLKAGIKTRNAAFNKLMDEIEHVAVHSRQPMLLTGPTGAGKSSLVRRIFELKKQRRQVSGRFVEVNCATIRGDGAMSALFGHKRGAFTGAITERAGLLREADKGLLFLDEVVELGLDEQAMLLRAIEEKRFSPLGSDREVESEFQLICGTNRDPRACVRDGRFRDDLLARINLWTFDLPGLALRREDIEPNIQFELSQLAAATGTAIRFNKEAMHRFMGFALSQESAWSGNFRDLNAAIGRMATLSPAGRITLEVAEAEIMRLKRTWLAPETGTADNNEHAADQEFARALLGTQCDEIDEFDFVQLSHVIRVCRESQTLSAAGRRLFAQSRKRRSIANDADRLRKYLLGFGLGWQQVHG